MQRATDYENRPAAISGAGGFPCELQPLGLAAQPPLKPCSFLGRLGQATDELTSSKAHIP